jgi:hypothetical protein
MLELFEKDGSTSTFYTAVAWKNSEVVLRQWVRQREIGCAQGQGPLLLSNN